MLELVSSESFEKLGLGCVSVRIMPVCIFLTINQLVQGHFDDMMHAVLVYPYSFR